MNTCTLSGTVATTPESAYRCFMDTTTFDLDATVGGSATRVDRLHVVALNQLALDTARLRIGDHVTINGYLRNEPVSTTDNTVTWRIEVVAYDIEPTHPRTHRRRNVP